jgi:RNase P subunit RPR2
MKSADKALHTSPFIHADYANHDDLKDYEDLKKFNDIILESEYDKLKDWFGKMELMLVI